MTHTTLLVCMPVFGLKASTAESSAQEAPKNPITVNTGEEIPDLYSETPENQVGRTSQNIFFQQKVDLLAKIRFE